MGALIPIAMRIVAQTFVTVVVASFTLFGYGRSANSPSWFSQALDLKYPVLVDVQEKNVEIDKKEIVATSTQENKKRPEKKSVNMNDKTPVATSTKVKYIPPAAEVAPVRTIPPAIKNPSLANLPVPSIPDPEIAAPTDDLGEWNAAHEAANRSVVNILCLSSQGNMVKVSIGSGVIISPRGLILTNAHVAETFLLPNQDCTIRQGEIAEDKYRAALVYINENWLRKNAGVIFSDNAQGTGEDDAALLLITGSAKNPSSMPAIKYAEIQKAEMDRGEKGLSVFAAAYPGGTLGALSLRKYLAFAHDATTISEVFTLDRYHTDIIETETTKVGQHGSSGGGIFDKNGNLVGLIVSVKTNTNESKINALTLPYISRSIKNDSGKSLEDFIEDDNALLLTSFLLKQNSLFEYVKPFIR